MKRLCFWILDRCLPDDCRDHVVGDLVEQHHRGSLWIAKQTIAALAQLRTRHHSGDGIVTTFLNDVRLAVRQLRRAPAFATTAILTLGLAIGATTAIFKWYAPQRQWENGDNQVMLVVRTKSDPASLAPSVRRAMAAIDPSQP